MTTGVKILITLFIAFVVTGIFFYMQSYTKRGSEEYINGTSNASIPEMTLEDILNMFGGEKEKMTDFYCANAIPGMLVKDFGSCSESACMKDRVYFDDNNCDDAYGSYNQWGSDNTYVAVCLEGDGCLDMPEDQGAEEQGAKTGVGFVITLSNENDDKSHLGSSHNDKITSLVVGEDYKVTLYENSMSDPDGSGDHITFYGSTIVENLGRHELYIYCPFWKRVPPGSRFGVCLKYKTKSWNDEVSAINVSKYNPETDEPLVIFYRAKDYKGSNREFNEQNVEINLDDDFKEVTSSIKIKEGYDLLVWNEDQ